MCSTMSTYRAHSEWLTIASNKALSGQLVIRSSISNSAIRVFVCVSSESYAKIYPVQPSLHLV